MMRAIACAAVAISLMATPHTARADGYGELGDELRMRKFASPRDTTDVDISGYFRVRGEHLYNLDLDRGLTPSGQPLFPVPLADPTAQGLQAADARLRTDLAIYPRGSGVSINMRVDVLDNIGLGSTPEGKPATGRAPSPAASPGQQPPAQSFLVKRAYGEVLTPFGLLAAGRMGSSWGLGLLSNSGDCDDCDGGDAADRVAFVSPMVGHIWAVSYDMSSSGPVSRRRDNARTLDIEPTDNVHSVTFAFMRYHTGSSRARRRDAGRATFEYGAYVSHRWQDNDVPADYLTTASEAPYSPSQVMARGYSATASDLWLRMTLPNLRVEAEAAYLHASVDQPSLVPGVLLDRSVTSDQVGLAVQTEYGPASGRFSVGLDFGYASGDPAPGFGAFPDPNAPAPAAGELDGAQADLPRDNAVDNFRFHPDFRIDRILFREIIGTVTDAIYLRPHAQYRLLDLGHAHLTASVSAVASWAAEASSTPAGDGALGLELDPTLRYASDDGFSVALEHAVFLPGAAFDNVSAGLSAKPAQLVRVRLRYDY